MRLLAVALALAALLTAQSQDPLVGVFANDRITLELSGTKGYYTGTVTLDGKKSPVNVTTVKGVDTGNFLFDGQPFSFAITPTETGVRVVNQGNEFLLERRGAATGANPGVSIGIVGMWRHDKGYARFNADGTGIIDGKSGRYIIRGNQITLMAGTDTLTLPFQVQGDSLTVMVNGAPVVLGRVREEAGGGSVRPELAGKWCWISVVNASQGGRTSSQCFTLNPNGTYQYYGESDNYNPNGSVANQSGDEGTWTATETTLTAVSRTRGAKVYSLVKRNHPKNGDPMLVLDGQTFVTFFKHSPW